MQIDAKLIKIAKANDEKISEEADLRDKSIEKFRDEKRKIKYAFEDQIRAIESKQRESENSFEKKIEEIESKSKLKIEELHKPIAELKRIVALMDVNQVFEGPKVYKFEHPKREDGSFDYGKKTIKVYYKPIDVLYENDTIKLNVYIVENKKPTNKFSLIAVGETIFKKDEFNLNSRNFYISGVQSEHYAMVGTVVKEAPTEKELKAYYEKNKSKVMADYIAKHKITEQDYKDVKEHCNTNEWKIALLESKKYYYEHDYSNGTEQPEYKKIIKQLEILQKNG
jgi:hypothetical protein